MTRTGSGLGPCTWGSARSAPTTSCQATSMGLAAARKNRRARSRSPRTRESCSATACSAVTDIPRAYAGFVLQIASPKTSSPAGKRRNRSYRRRRLAGNRWATMSSSGSASRIAARTSGGATVSRKARKPSGSAGGWCPSYPISVRTHRCCSSASSTKPVGRPGSAPTATNFWPGGAQAQVPGGVPQVDRELLLRRLVVADRRQPGRRTAAAPGGVENQIGAEGLLGAGRAAPDPHPGDAVSGGGGVEPDDVALVDDLDGGQRPDPGAQLTFEVGPAGLPGGGLCRVALEAERMAARREAHLGKVPDDWCTPGDEVVEQSRKELVDDLRPSGEQHMGVSALGYAPSIPGRVGERIAFHDSDALVRVGQHPGGE